MPKRTGIIVAATLLICASCGGGDNSGDAEPGASAAQTTPGPVTAATEAPTTTVPDELTAALADAGYAAPTDEQRDAISTFCNGFAVGDIEAVNAAAGDPELAELLTIGFAVECPDHAAAVGTAIMPSGDPVFPGFPRIVDVSTIDSRVASWFEGDLVDGQVVAVAPGVYTPYNPNAPDLIGYITVPTSGDCVMREQFFPRTGGTCWDGVQAGSSEG